MRGVQVPHGTCGILRRGKEQLLFSSGLVLLIPFRLAAPLAQPLVNRGKVSACMALSSITSAAHLLHLQYYTVMLTMSKG